MMEIVCEYNKTNDQQVYVSVEYEKPIRSFLTSSIPYANLVSLKTILIPKLLVIFWAVIF